MKKSLNKSLVVWMVVLIMALLPISGFAMSEGICGDNLVWTLTDGVLTISGSGAMDDYASVNDTPWKDDRTNITALVIRDGVTGIGANAFYACNNLKSVTIGNDLAVIADNAFSRCGNLDNVYGFKDVIAGLIIGENNTAFTGATYSYMLSGDCGDNLTYYYDGKDTLTISGSGDMYNYVENINGELTAPAPWYEFAASIKKINLPDGLTSIGDRAFENVAAEEIVIPESVKRIGLLAFSAVDIKSVKIPGGVERIDVAFAYSDIETLVLSEGITTIDWQEFFGCWNLKEVHIPSTVTVISEKAFEECDAITDVYYNGSLAMWAEIEVGENNGSLLDAQFHYLMPTDPVTKCGDKLVWYYEDGVLTISGSGDMYNYVENINGELTAPAPWYDVAADIKVVNLPDGLTSIGDRAFENVAAEEIDIPESVKRIGLLAFSAADIKSVKIPGGVERIDVAFAYSDVEKLVISEGITNIGWQAFFGCWNLKEVHIPSTVTEISKKAFEECDAITDVYYDGTQTMWDNITIGEQNGSLLTGDVHCNAVILYGNVDGDVEETSVDSADLQVLKNYIKGGITLSQTALLAADLDGDGFVDSADLQELKAYISKGRLFTVYESTK